MTMRHVESMARLAHAHAKMHLREVVNDEDCDFGMIYNCVIVVLWNKCTCNV
jgi:DNA replicative helicase MCM subunit Mcm2 (Cdc46/Mcm family)